MSAFTTLRQVTRAWGWLLKHKTVSQVAFMEDTRETYSEMRDEFFASLEDRRYLSIGAARAKGLKVGLPHCLQQTVS